jgi:hypothetical protein
MNAPGLVPETWGYIYSVLRRRQDLTKITWTGHSPNILGM